jgi:hypothetical protein
MDQEIFVTLGVQKLSGKRTSSHLLDAWWKVRMGLPLQRNHSHQLLITNQHWEKDKGDRQTFGHFCFALKKRAVTRMAM